MNDVKSLLIATTVLAIGGLGLYMYKSEKSEFDDDDDDDNSDSSSQMSDVSELSDASSHLEEEDIDNYVSKKTNKGTKKNSKKNGGTRKKH